MTIIVIVPNPLLLREPLNPIAFSALPFQFLTEKCGGKKKSS